MSTTKRVSGSYTIETYGSNNITLTANAVSVSNTILANAIVASQTSNFANVNIGNASVTGQVTAGVFVGDGTGITGIAAGNALGNIISYGTSNVAIPNLSGNVRVAVGGVANVLLVSIGGANVAGNLSADAYYWSNGVPFASGTVTYDSVPVAPVSPNVGDFWFNTTNGILYQYNDDGDTNQWVDISGIGTPPAMTGADANSVIQRDLNGSATANRFLGNGITVSGNVQTTAGYYLGNGSLLTGIQTSTANIFSGTTILQVVSPSGEIKATIGGLDVISITADGIVNNQANSVGNIGSSVKYFNTVFATSTSAQYADLAEIFESDESYEPGTILVFGGSKEVTTTTKSHDHRVAGVVSTAPAYLMNTKKDGVALALTGRVPAMIKGPISKGDLITTSNIAGVGEVCNPLNWHPGCVIGKSLETIDDDRTEMIEIAVGRY